MKAIIAAASGLVVGMLPASTPVLAADTTPSLASTGRAESCILDANSGCTVRHGFGVKPTAVVVVPAGQAIVSVNPSQTTASSYRVRYTKPNGGPFAAGTRVTFYTHYDFTGTHSPHRVSRAHPRAPQALRRPRRPRLRRLRRRPALRPRKARHPPRPQRLRRRRTASARTRCSRRRPPMTAGAPTGTTCTTTCGTTAAVRKRCARARTTTGTSPRLSRTPHR